MIPAHLLALPLRPLRRRVFWAYAAVIVVLTHWPNLEVPNPIPRTDIFVHISVFGLWNILACSCGWFGNPLDKKNILRSTLVAAVYAAIDESTQAFPFVHRHAGFDDYGANLLGILTAAGFLWFLRSRLTPRP